MVTAHTPAAHIWAEGRGRRREWPEHPVVKQAGAAGLFPTTRSPAPKSGHACSRLCGSCVCTNFPTLRSPTSRLHSSQTRNKLSPGPLKPPTPQKTLWAGTRQLGLKSKHLPGRSCLPILCKFCLLVPRPCHPESARSTSPPGPHGGALLRGTTLGPGDVGSPGH